MSCFLGALRVILSLLYILKLFWRICGANAIVTAAVTLEEREIPTGSEEFFSSFPNRITAHKIPWLPMVVPADSSPMEFSVYMWLLAILLGWILSRPALAITAALASLVPLFVARTLDFDA